MPLIYATDGAHLLGWDPLGGFTTIATFSQPVDAIAFAPDGQLLGVSGKTILQIDAATGTVLSSLVANSPFGFTGLSLSPDRRAFVPIEDGGAIFDVNLTTGATPNFARKLIGQAIDGIVSAYGDTIVFNNRMWSLSLIDTTLGTPVSRTPALLGFNLSTGTLEHYFELNRLLPSGFSGDRFTGMAIGQDGHLYLTGPGRNGVGAAVFRVELSPFDRGDRTEETTLVLVSESATQAALTDAAGALDSSRVLSIGGSGNDVLTPWSDVAPARLHGHAGNDTLTAGARDDELYGGAGDDSLSGLDGTDDLFGEDGNDRLSGAAGNDVLQGGLGNDTLSGGDGSDILQDDGVGTDSIVGGAGNDLVLAAGGNDTALGDAGNDQIYGEDGADSIRGGAGADRAFGGAGADTLRGDAGDDRLYGDGDSDDIAGGPGADTLYGGLGADRFRFESQSDYYIAPSPFGPPVLNRFTPDVIADFWLGDGIDLSALFDSFGAVAGALTAAQLRAQGWLRVTQSGPDALVQVDSNGPAAGAGFLTVAVLQNTQAAALTDLVFLV